MQKQKTIYQDIESERMFQDAKWGVQNHTAQAWLPILLEEVGEVARALNEHDEAEYLAELVQVAAVAVAMIESHRRNGA